MLGRDLRTRLDLLKPDVRRRVENSQFVQKSNVKSNRRCNLLEDDQVFANDNRSSKSKRAEAVIVKQNSPSTFDVKFEDDYVCKKHANQLVSTKLNEVSSGGKCVSERRRRIKSVVNLNLCYHEGLKD